MIEPLLLALHDDEPDVRLAVLDALEKINDGRIVEPLIAVLDNDENSEVREKAVRLLGEIKDNRAVEPLIGVLKKENDELIKSVTAAVLSEITGEAFGSNADEWEGWKLEN